MLMDFENSPPYTNYKDPIALHSVLHQETPQARLEELDDYAPVGSKIASRPSETPPETLQQIMYLLNSKWEFDNECFNKWNSIRTSSTTSLK